MDSIARDVINLQNEIRSTNEQMIQGVFMALLCIVAAFITAEVTGKANLHKLVLVFSVTTTFWICRQDYIIHRAGAYIEMVEMNSATGLVDVHQAGWEASKQRLKSRNMMFPADILAATALVWILYTSGAALMHQGEARFVYLCVGGVLSGIAMTVVMLQLARARW